MRVLAIGEAPSRRNPDGVPLASLLDRIGESTLRQHVVELHGMNLFKLPQPPAGKGSRFPMDEARERATDLLPMLRRRGRHYDQLWLVGKRVAKAFGLGGQEYFVKAMSLCEVRIFCSVVVVPHPSGVNHFWNDRAKVAGWRMFVERQTT